MTREEAEALAAEYALGTLGAAERERFAQALARDQHLQGLVEDWQSRLAPLAENIDPVEPPPQLWATIEKSIDDEDAVLPGTITVHAEDEDWRTIAPGVDVKLLYINREEGYQNLLLRCAPGARIPSHDHRQSEEAFVLEGSLEVGPKFLKAGDYHIALAGTPHPDIISKAGCLIYLRTELDDIAA